MTMIYALLLKYEFRLFNSEGSNLVYYNYFIKKYYWDKIKNQKYNGISKRNG